MGESTFWHQRRVLVTGSGGFLGSHLTRLLEEKKPAALFLPRSREVDLRQPEAVGNLLAETRPDLIIHLAANVGGIGANRKRPAEFFYDNLMMGVPLLHQAYTSGVQKFVSVGTVCSYPKHCPVPFREQDLWNGYPEETNAPYGLAKKMLLVAGQAYRQQYGFNSIFLLPTNLYGPGDHADLENSHVIPVVIRKCLEATRRNEPEVVVWGTGSPTREFLYVTDAARGILQACQAYDGSEPVNLGSGAEISIRDLVNTIARHVGFEGKLVWDESKPDGQPRRALSTARAEQLFGFQAEVGFEEGLKRTVDWFASRL